MINKIKQRITSAWKWIKCKFIWLFLGTVVLAAGGSQLPAQVPDLATLQNEYTNSAIQGKYKMENASFIREAKDENAIQIEVGDKMKQKFVPSMKIAKWEDEVSMRVAPKTNTASKKKDFVIEGEKIKYKEDKKEFHFYEIEDGYEVEVILLEKPETNIVEMEIETNGLDFFYQQALNIEMASSTCTATDCGGSHRPENVVGSYAVYHSTKSNNALYSIDKTKYTQEELNQMVLGKTHIGKTNDRDEVDYFKVGKKYMTGKAFHIYRPKIIDSVGTEVWGKLNITNNLLTVEIPQEFLDNAVYPVRHAAGLTFGDESKGGSYANQAAKYLKGSKFLAPANGTITSLSTYAEATHADDIKQGIYLSDQTRIDYTSGMTVSGSAYQTQVVVGSGSIISGNYYYIVAIGNANTYLYYDSTGSTDVYQNVGSYAVPSPGSIIEYTTRSFSIYCTYTAGGAEARRIIITQ